MIRQLLLPASAAPAAGRGRRRVVAADGAALGVVEHVETNAAGEQSRNRREGAHSPGTPEAGSPSMITLPEPQPRTPIKRDRRMSDAAFSKRPPRTLRSIADGIEACRRCDLWRDATQGVPGEGRSTAELMLVGEQPGDQEDLVGSLLWDRPGASWTVRWLTPASHVTRSM